VTAPGKHERAADEENGPELQAPDRTLRRMRRRLVVFGIVAVLVAAGLGMRAYLTRDTRDPAKAAALVRLGLQDLDAQRVDVAIAKFRKAIAADDRSRDAHYDLGYALQTFKHKPADAEPEYRRALDIDPGYDKALYSLATVRAGANDFAEAIALYRRAVAANPNFAEAHLNLGLLLIDHGNEEQGRAEVAKGIELNPELGSPIATSTTTTTAQSGH
jgi:tetratricopeptide (TPR) repeat protein